MVTRYLCRNLILGIWWSMTNFTSTHDPKYEPVGDYFFESAVWDIEIWGGGGGLSMVVRFGVCENVCSFRV